MPQPKLSKNTDNKQQATLNFINKYRLPLAALVLLLASMVILARGGSNTEKCQEHYRHDSTVYIAPHSIRTEVARSDAARQKGLSGRACIPGGTGMLFAFDQNGYHDIWMKDMRFPIDIIWLDANKKVATITANVSPATYPASFTSKTPAKYVLEVRAGEASRLGLVAGQKAVFTLPN